jgi:hypothetical protein
MKIIKRLNDLAPVALAGLLLVSAAPVAVAATAHAAGVSNNVITQADYLYHKKHYAYHYKGHYYNHRSETNGQWHYN